MTGNIVEMNDPANANGNVNVYPNAMFVDESGVEPSIRSRPSIEIFWISINCKIIWIIAIYIIYSTSSFLYFKTFSMVLRMVNSALKQMVTIDNFFLSI